MTDILNGGKIEVVINSLVFLFYWMYLLVSGNWKLEEFEDVKHRDKRLDRL